MPIKLLQGDCLELMKDIPDGSVDMCLTDPPYGTTACKWDSVIPFEPMWEQLKRIVKPNGAIALFGSEPFSSALRMSNIKMFKYDWIWDKITARGHLVAKKRPMCQHEIISIFYSSAGNYRPQMTKKEHAQNGSSMESSRSSICGGRTTKMAEGIIREFSYPKTILKYSISLGGGRLHPTQKPVSLLEYLIKTYTQEGELVLDFTMGSGSTGVACVNLARSFIGIEKDPEYFQIARNRIKEAMRKMKEEPRHDG